jgi:hypothetical protein
MIFGLPADPVSFQLGNFSAVLSGLIDKGRKKTNLLVKRFAEERVLALRAP